MESSWRPKELGYRSSQIPGVYQCRKFGTSKGRSRSWMQETSSGPSQTSAGAQRKFPRDKSRKGYRPRVHLETPKS